MTYERFDYLADAYGGDLRRWPEAEREAARAQAYSVFSRREAQLVPLERELSAMTETTGWKLTAPLRQLNALRRRARAGSRPAR